MFSSINRTLFDIPITWNQSRFQTTRSKYHQARKLIQHSINIQFQKELKYIRLQNETIEKHIFEIDGCLSKHDEKVLVFDNLTHIASESLPTHLERRMNHIRTILEQHFHIIQNVLQQENQYWKTIHSVLDRNLITSNDIFISTKQERMSSAYNSMNKTYVTKPENVTNRMDFEENYLDFMEPKIVLNRIGQGFLIDCLKSDEDNQENSFYNSKSTSEIKAERQSYGQKRKQSVLEDNDDNDSSTIALRKRKSISIIEIDEATPKRRRNKKPKKKQELTSSLTINNQTKHFNTRLSIRTQQSNPEIHQNIMQSKYSPTHNRRKKLSNY